MKLIITDYKLKRLLNQAFENGKNDTWNKSFKYELKLIIQNIKIDMFPTKQSKYQCPYCGNC